MFISMPIQIEYSGITGPLSIKYRINGS
uniref:Uncharacterized protein n=1 Tax=Arundo donax TaxID=35708 RepID=A0A0A9HM60_ARUDO